MLLRGLSDEFQMAPKEPQVGSKVSMADWNPMLVAIAFKRTDIVRYFIQELKISVKLACRDPTLPATLSM